MAHYRKGKKSPWVAQVRDHAGRIQTASFATRKAAEDFEDNERDKRKRIRHGLSSPRDQLLFLDYAAHWLKKRYATMPQSSVDQDESRLRKYWLPLIGPIHLQYIQTAIILEELDRIRFKLGHSPADRNRHRALLHKLFQDAIFEDKLDVNPVSRIPLEDEYQENGRSKRVLSAEEQTLYIEALYAENSHYGIIGDLLLWTGGRICSVNVVQYQDVDHERGTISLRRIEERASGQVRERQKGRRKKRRHETIIPLFPILREAILRHKIKSAHTKLTDFIACRGDGKFIPYDSFKDAHIRVIKALKISPFIIHDLRRTFASNCERMGFTKSDIQQMLGHSTIIMTEGYTIPDIKHLVEKGKRIGFGDNEPSYKIIPLREAR